MDDCDEQEFHLGYEPQKELVYNKLLPYADRLDLESEQLLVEVKTNLGRAIVLREMNPGAVFWALQLVRYIQFYGRKFSKDDHILFVKMSYEIVTIPDLELDVIQSFAQLLTLLLKKKSLISREDLVLQWRPLAELYERILYSSNKHTEMIPLPITVVSTLKAVIWSCRVYFSIESTEEMLNEWRPLLCPFDATMNKAMMYFELFLPTLLPPEHHGKGFKLWFQDMMDIWSACLNTPLWEYNLVSLFARLANSNIGYIDWEPYLPMIFTRLLRSFSLPGGSSTSTLHIVRPITTFESNSIAMWIVAMLGGGNSCQQHIGRLFRTLESYYHPSNNGKWMGKLQLLLCNLPTSLIKRLYRERKKQAGWETPIPEAHQLTVKDITEFVESMKHVVLLSVFSKGGSGGSALALKNLSLIRPEIVIPPLLERLYSALETLTEPHRLTATMHCVISVSRALVRSNKHFVEGPTHVIPLLIGCLPGIDPNDIKKCMVTFKFVATLTTLIPLVDCSKALDVRTDLTEIEQQLCLATTQFEDFLLQFMDRCFALIENSSRENPSRLDRDAAKRSIEESIQEVGLSSTFYSILKQSSPEIFSSALSKLYAFVSSHILETKVSGKLAANMCRSASKVNAELSLRTFLPHFSKLVMALTESCDVLEEELLDDELLFSLLILSELVRCDGRYLVGYKEILEKVISRLIHLKSRAGYLLVGTLLRNILKSLTSIHPLDFCSVKIDWESCSSFEDYFPVRDWGKPGDLKDLVIDWHNPNEEELSFATDLLDKFLGSELQSLGKWSAEEETMTKEELQRSLSIVHNCILGAGEVLPIWQQENVNIATSSVPLYCVRIKNTGNSGVSFSDGRNIRLSCASVLRQVLVQILKVYEDDTKSLFLVVKIYHALMFHWGISREDYDKRLKSFNVVKSATRNKLAGSKQYSRALLINWVWLQHEFRMLERSKTALTPLHLSIMGDLLLLAVSHYSEVRTRAQVTLQSCFYHFQFASRAFMSEIIALLKQDPIAHHESFKGALYVLIGRKNNSYLSVNHWDSLHEVWPAIVAIQPSEKPSIIRLLDHITMSIKGHLKTMQIKLELPMHCVEVAKKLWSANSLNQNITFPGDHLVEEGIVIEQQRNENNLKHYLGLISSLQDWMENGSLHWRHYHLAFSMLSILTRFDVTFPARTVKFFVQHLVHETLNIRKIAISTVAAILKQQKRKHGKSEFDASTIDVKALPLHDVLRDLNVQELPSNLWLQYNSLTNPDTLEKWENTTFIHKTHVGFYCWPKPLLVYQSDSHQPLLDRAREDLTEEEAAVFDCFSDPSFVDSFTTYLSLEERKGCDKFSAKRFHLFKGLFRNFGDTFLPLFISHVTEKVTDKQDSAQRCGAEILAGILRGSKHWPFEKTKALQEQVIPIMISAFDSITTETVVDWGIFIATVSGSRDPKKHHWLFELLMDRPLRGDAGSFLESSRIYLLLVLLTLQEWRVFELLHRLLIYLEPHMMHAYQNVREKLGSVLCNIFLYDVKIPHAFPCLSLAPKLSPFIQKLLPKLSILVADATSNGTGNVVNSLSSHGTNNHFIDTVNADEKKDAKNLLKTICKWLQACVTRTLYCAPPEVYCFLPVLCLLQCDTVDDELSKDCMYTTVFLGQALLLPKSISTAIETVAGIAKSVSWHARSMALSFLQLMVFSNLFTVMNNEKWVSDISQLVLKLLGDERLEVRVKSGETLGGFLHCDFIKVSDELIETFIVKCNGKLRKRKVGTANVTTVEPADLIERHSGILGLCACVSAYPYDVPPFLPEILVKLGDHLNDPQPIPATIKKTLSNFRRTHHDNWRDHKLRFTDNQLAVITDLLVSPSYYA